MAYIAIWFNVRYRESALIRGTTYLGAKRKRNQTISGRRMSSIISHIVAFPHLQSIVTEDPVGGRDVEEELRQSISQ